MRASVLRDGRMVLRDDVDEPAPGPGQVLVGIKACGVCGSDLHFAKHGQELVDLTDQVKGLPQTAFSVDLAKDVFMGHEFSAEILDAGPGTPAPPSGTIVTSMPLLLSENGFELMVFNNSVVCGYAERILLSAPMLLTVPNGLDPRHAALTEPMSVGVHAVNKSGVSRGETALVLGCGPVGIAVIAALKTKGVETIVAADFSPMRRRLAETMGAVQTIDPAGGSPFDTVSPSVIFEAVGVRGIIDDAVLRAPLGSRIVSVGMSMQPDTVRPLVAAAKEINIQFVFGQTPEEFAATLRALAEGEIDVAPMITGEVGLDGVGEAFDDLADPERHCKILVTP